MSYSSNRFVPSLDVLDARINLSTLVGTPDAPPDVGPVVADVKPQTAENETHASNQGWGHWEVNAATATDAGGITKFGSRRLILQSETYAGATEPPVGASESITIGGPQVETRGNVYTITFGGSLVG